MLPYRCYGLDDFRCEYEALAKVDPDGAWYKREEVDALIATLVEAMQRAADSFRSAGLSVDADELEEAMPPRNSHHD